MSRGERLAGAVAERGLDALLVTDLVNVRYLTGYTGSNGLALVGPGMRGGSSRTSATPRRSSARCPTNGRASSPFRT